jgi:hypothetical protein
LVHPYDETDKDIQTTGYSKPIQLVQWRLTLELGLTGTHKAALTLHYQGAIGPLEEKLYATLRCETYNIRFDTCDRHYLDLTSLCFWVVPLALSAARGDSGVLPYTSNLPFYALSTTLTVREGFIDKISFHTRSTPSDLVVGLQSANSQS